MRLSILAASLISLGCGAVERVKYVQHTGDKPEWTPNCESAWVDQGGQWPCDVHLTLSVYWATKSDYTENFKVKIKNRDLVANLKVSLYGKTREAFKSENFIVRAGQQLEWEGYSIYIEEIRLWPKATLSPRPLRKNSPQGWSNPNTRTSAVKRSTVWQLAWTSFLPRWATTPSLAISQFTSASASSGGNTPYSLKRSEFGLDS